MIRVWLTSENGDGHVNNLDFEDLEAVTIYTDNIAKGVQITIEEIEEVKKEDESTGDSSVPKG